MRNLLVSLSIIALGSASLTGCIEVVDPQSSNVTLDQAANAPGSYNNFVSSITSSLIGNFVYSPSNQYPYDIGYPGTMIMRDVSGQDMIPAYSGSWFSTWYQCGRALGPQYAICQVPWTYYYGWIKNCNVVLQMSGATPEGEKKTGAGIAYAMRAFFYMDLAQMFSQKTYLDDKNAETVPIVTEDESIDLTHNPRATNEKMWAFILSDLDKAEEDLKDYKRTNIYTPDVSVVYGLKARAYLITGDWANAEKYAKLAQEGYQMMDESAYTSRETGFNTPNSAWMFGMTYKSTDPCITNNDADSSWGSAMSLEINPDPQKSGCGYAANYGQQLVMDRHLYESIPATDFRKKNFVDFAIDDMADKDEKIKALEAYSDYPSWIYSSGMDGYYKRLGGLSLKFRVAGGEAGHNDQHVGFIQAVPLMRVEEMKLIEAEAAGRQDESRGISLLTAFAKSRDASYVYGTHNESYGNVKTSKFLNEIWWERRVELWGEGFAAFDIKRLDKGVIRNYAGTNQVESFRWNTTTPPQWMTYCIIQTETNYNRDCTQNPIPLAPTADSPEYQW